MKLSNTFVRSLFLSLLLVIQTGCLGGGSDSSSSNSQIPTDTLAPSYTIMPASDTAVGTQQHIVIVFSESMDTTTLVFSGSLTQESSPVWSNTHSTNDTLTLSPTTAWTLGNKTLTVDAKDLAGNSAATISGNYIVDATIPSANVSPASSAILTASQPITIHFYRSMDTSSLSLGGTMVADSDGGTWSSTTYPDDTLTIRPSSTWTTHDGTAMVNSADASLAIAVSDLSASPINPLSLNYTKNTIHVSPAGNDTAAGTSSQPKLSIQAALAAAARLQVTNLRVQAGTYPEAVNLKPGINIRGGFDTNWNQTSTTNVIVDAYHYAQPLHGQYQAIEGNTINQATTLQFLQINAPDAPTGTGDALSSYGISVFNSNALNLKNIVIHAGNGASGNNGSNGQNAPSYQAASGSPGGPANQQHFFCNDVSSGAGGAGGIGASYGGSGGRGGTMDSDCGIYNFKATAGMSGYPGSNSVSAFGGNGGAVCNAGGNGFTGSTSDGWGGSAIANTGSSASGFWHVTGNGTDGSLGVDGGGGSGGGGSGGCDANIDSWGAGGGGGGAGGEHSPVAGSGGKAGGSSFGIYLNNSSITLDTVTIVMAHGGNGGNGGHGGYGQPGGLGGAGGAAAPNTGAGGNGGNGGDGGDSGAGAGGSGGHAYGIYQYSSSYSGTNVVIDSSKASGGTGGSAGGTAGGALPAEKGNNGSLTQVY